MLDQHTNHMAIAVAYKDQSKELLAALNENKFPVTLIDAYGGQLQEEMITLIAAMPKQRLPFFFYLVREHCPERTRFVPVDVIPPEDANGEVVEVRLGGATVFVVPVETDGGA